MPCEEMHILTAHLALLIYGSMRRIERRLDGQQEPLL